MKIPPPVTTPPPNASVKPSTPLDRGGSKRATSASQSEDTRETGRTTSSSGGARDFASVLHEAVHSRRDDGEERGDDEHEDRQTARQTERSDRERDVRRREDEQDEAGAGGGFGNRANVREVTTRGTEAAAARSILHIADLERIIAAVRAQTLANGRREVTLELQRSVLEGLRIKISTDEAGRVTAEFIAASERVRAQLDARSAELADVLRSRGVNLASLRTTMNDAGSSNQNELRGNQTRGEVAASSPMRAPSNASLAPDGIDESESDATGGATYRA